MDLIIVDCQNDFVTGSLAAPNGPEVVEKIRKFLDESKEEIRVFYSADFHPINHMSFKNQGGPWPNHCVENTFGAEIHNIFSDSKFIPNADNTYLKGRNPEKEEYSAFDAKTIAGNALKDELSDHVYVVGIASEYCVRETALAFHDYGKKVHVIENLLGYIDENDHKDNILDLEKKGIEIK